MGSSFQLLNSELAIYILAFVKTICFCFVFFLLLFFSFLSSITCTHPFYFKFSMLAIFLVGLSLLQISNRQIIINISQNELLSSSPLPSQFMFLHPIGWEFHPFSCLNPQTGTQLLLTISNGTQVCTIYLLMRVPSSKIPSLQ